MLRPHPQTSDTWTKAKSIGISFRFERGDSTNANFIDRVHSRL
jgi:hypothetical protein